MKCDILKLIVQPNQDVELILIHEGLPITEAYAMWDKLQTSVSLPKNKFGVSYVMRFAGK